MWPLITLVYLGWYSKANIVSFVWVCQTQISIWKLQEMHRFYPGPLHRGSCGVFLVNKFSQDITFKNFKCFSQIILLKQLLMRVGIRASRNDDTYVLSCCLLHCSSLITFHGHEWKDKRKRSLVWKKIQKEDVSEGGKASQFCPLLLQGENETCW